MAYIYTPIGSPLENGSVAAAKTFSLPVGANGFLVQAITQNVRISLDGTDPTASAGLQIKAGDPVRLLMLGGSSFKALQETGTAYFYCQPVRVDWVGP